MKDIKVELDDEFLRNFERRAFFDRPWAPLSPNYAPNNGSMLIRTGALRRSLNSRIHGTKLTYISSLKYAGIHNYGGTIRQDFVPTPKMRKWAWAKHRKHREAGDTAEAEKFKRMALAKRIKRTITMPARPFVGDHPLVREIVSDVVQRCMEEEVEKKLIAEELRKFPKK